MKKLKEELNDIIEWIEEEENKNMEEIHMTKVEINNSWIDEKEIENETLEERKLKIIHRKINQVINLMRERNELYEVRMVYELQPQTKKIEELKKQLDTLLNREIYTNKGKDQHIILDLITVINWINDEQKKYKL